MDEPTESLNALSGAVIGAAIEVHRRLGPGILESVYEQALCVELRHREIPFVRQAPFQVRYRDVVVGESRLDLVVGGQIVVELKAVDQFLPIHQAQLLSYLKATGLPLGLLINFKVMYLADKGIKRVVRTDPL